ncbi:hypothetical protein FOZ62_029637 [Perkinsus olseni]|uniref:Uncharacterized protein n=1 Tax=Perkinsus olseni TaxID=32597 RepID=A0A7J6QSH2_PEROL|nr:hypothetical protein FOZ62_029637 [Perkinsus olseni]
MLLPRLRLHLAIIPNLAWPSHGLMRRNNGSYAIPDTMDSPYQFLREAEHSYAKLPLAANQGDGGITASLMTGFPPPGLYENRTFGVVLSNEGPQQGTFTFLFDDYTSFVFPYINMTPSVRAFTYNCYTPGGTLQTLFAGGSLRRLLGIESPEPFKPSNIRLCRSVEGDRTWMIVPSGSVGLSWKPLPLEETRKEPSTPGRAAETQRNPVNYDTGNALDTDIMADLFGGITDDDVERALDIDAIAGGFGDITDDDVERALDIDAIAGGFGGITDDDVERALDIDAIAGGFGVITGEGIKKATANNTPPPNAMENGHQRFSGIFDGVSGWAELPDPAVISHQVPINVPPLSEPADIGGQARFAGTVRCALSGKHGHGGGCSSRNGATRASELGSAGIAEFPPSGLYENRAFGIEVEIEGIDKCTFTFLHGQHHSFPFPISYSGMVLSGKTPSFNCFNPAGDQEVQHLTTDVRRMVGIGRHEPLQPSDITLCHSVDGADTWVVFPRRSSLTVPLRWSPLPAVGRAVSVGPTMWVEHQELDKIHSGRRLPQEVRRKRKRMGMGFDDIHGTELGHHQSLTGDDWQSDLWNANPGAAKIPRLIESPRGMPRSEGSDSGYEADSSPDILATAVAFAGITEKDIDEEGAYSSGSSHAENGISQPSPTAPIGVPVHPNLQLVPRKEPQDTTSMGRPVFHTDDSESRRMSASGGTPSTGGELGFHHAQNAAYTRASRVLRPQPEPDDGGGTSLAFPNQPETASAGLAHEYHHGDRSNPVRTGSGMSVASLAMAVDGISGEGSGGEYWKKRTSSASLHWGEKPPSQDLLGLDDDPLEEYLRELYRFLNFTGSAKLVMIAMRIWLHSTALLYMVQRSCALTSGPEEGHRTKDPLERRWRSPGRGHSSTGADAVAGFPPAGMYANESFGIVVKIKGIDNCTFTLNAFKLALPYSSMVLDEAEGTFKCYIPSEDEEVHHLGRALRDKIGLKWREPLKPFHVRLCHSVEDGRTWMEFPSGPVPLKRRKPLPSLGSGGGQSQQPPDVKFRATGKEVARTVRPRSPSQTDMEDRKRVKRALDDSRETVLGRAEMKEPPRQRSGGTEVPRETAAHGSVRRPELSYMGYATGNPLDILVIAAALSTPAESYKRGPSHSVGIVNQPIPGPSVGLTAWPLHPYPAVALHEAPTGVPPTEAVATSTGREEAGGGRVSGTEMGVLGDENRRRSEQGQKLAYVSPNRAAELSPNPNDIAKTVRAMTWWPPGGLHDHTVDDQSGTNPTTATTMVEQPHAGPSDGGPGELETPGSIAAPCSTLEAKGGYLDCGENSSMDLLASETGSHEANSDHTEHSSLINIDNEMRQATMGAEVDSIYAASSGGERWTDRVASDSVSPVSSEDEFYFEDLLKWFEDSTPEDPSEFDKI